MIPSLLLALQAYTATVDEPKVTATDRDASVEFNFATNLPDKAVVTLRARPAEYEYGYEQDRLAYLGPSCPSGADLKTTAPVAGGKVKGLRLTLPANGVYGFEIRFDPADQAYGPLMRKKMGPENFGLLSLHERTIAVGVADKAFDEMLADSAACRDVLAKCRAALDALDKIADGEESKMAALAGPHLKDLEKLHDVVNGRLGKTLVNGTYKYVSQVLNATGLAAQFIERLAKAKKDPKPLEGPTENGKPSAVPRQEDPPLPSPIPDSKNPFLSFGGIRTYIDRADVVRLREVLLWLVKFSRLALERPDGAEATVKAIESTLQKLQKGEPNFEEWAVLKGGDRLTDVPAKLRECKAGDAEARKALESILDAFDKKLSK